MNIFYALPEQITENSLQLKGSEAKHASKTLRYEEGDAITVVDGTGGWYEGTISRITPKNIWVEITSKEKKAPKSPRIVAAVGIIKKKSRFEFAAEKTVELGAAEIAVFRGEHSIKQNVRTDRLDTIALSAMKQSLQAWLPQIKSFNSLHELLKHYKDYTIFAAHKSGKKITPGDLKEKANNFLLITGPEGDFSENELQIMRDENVRFISLGANRLRTETAVITLLNTFLTISAL